MRLLLILSLSLSAWAEENDNPPPPSVREEQDNAMRGNRADVIKFVDSLLTPSKEVPPLPPTPQPEPSPHP